MRIFPSGRGEEPHSFHQTRRRAHANRIQWNPLGSTHSHPGAPFLLSRRGRDPRLHAGRVQGLKAVAVIVGA